MAIYSFHGFTLTGIQTPDQVQASTVSPGFFATLAGCGKIELQRVFLAVVHLSRCQTI
jgi:hypothetical protein